MIQASFAACFAVLASGALHRPLDVPTRFEELHGKGDRAGCAALWRENPNFVLPALARDLDRALSLREGAPAAEGSAESAPRPETASREATAEARMLEERALWGALVAREALGKPLIAELVAARVGWTERDRRLHRDRIAIAGRARASLEKGDDRDGLEAAQESATRALALLDWHAVAAAYEACGIAHQALSSFEDALVAWSQARHLYRDLSLAADEERCLRGVLDMCFTTERNSLGREFADQAAELAHGRGEKAAEAELLDRRAGFEERLGRKAEAQATRARAKALASAK